MAAAPPSDWISAGATAGRGQHRPLGNTLGPQVLPQPLALTAKFFKCEGLPVV